MRPEIQKLLSQLKSRIRRYVLLEGTASLLAVLGIAFWFSLVLDYLFELPRLLRALLLLGTGCLFLGTLVVWVLLRLVRELRSRALALVLERRFPALNDRLITTVELGAGDHAASSLTGAMLRRTGDEIAGLLRSLELREVFNLRPLLRVVLLAACLVLSIAGFAWAYEDVLGLWYRRNVLLANEYWPRETDLHVVVLADPGERPVEFRDGVYRHPRGGNLTLLAEVPKGMKVPAQVQFSFGMLNRSGGGRDYMLKIGQTQFRHTIPNLHDSLEIWLKGGDYSSRAPFVIEVVDAPRIDSLTLQSLYPKYTGKNETDDDGQPLREAVAVNGTQVSLDAGTDFQMQATVNKPLESVRIDTEAYQLRFNQTAATLRIAGGEELPLPVSQIRLSPDGLSFSVPFVLSTAPQPQYVDEKGQVLIPLRLPPDAIFRISLHDTDDIVSAEPARLTVNSIPDEPPRIETRLRGIGKAITRQAVLPVTGQILDDHGVASARFEFKVGEPGELREVEFSQPPAGKTEFDVDERFEVLPLDLEIGQTLTLTVSADDSDNLTGPHRGHSEKYPLQIVSNDELLAIIAARELNLRRRFEQILDEVTATRKDLDLHRGRLQELQGKKPAAGAEAGSKPDAGDVRMAAITSVERAINGLRKNANETGSVEQSFADILEELKNNVVPDIGPLIERIGVGIVKPLHQVDTVDYNTIDELLVLLGRDLEQQADPFPKYEATLAQLDETIARLQAVLTQMLKLETFNEAIQLLREIIKQQEQLNDKTKSERKKKLLEGLQ